MLYIILMCISHFTSFANELLLAIYFICTLDHGNDVRQKTNLKQFSYSSSKWVIKQRRQLATPTMLLAQKLLMNIQGRSGSRSFAKETRALKMKRTVASHQKLTKTNWENHQSWSSYNNMRSCWRTQCQPFYGHSAFEADWKGEEAWWVGASWADLKSKIFWSVIFSFSMQQQWTISQLNCDMRWKLDCIQQLVKTSSVVGLRRFKAKLAPKKAHVHCLVLCR